MIRLQCPGCHKILSVDDSKQGDLIACPACKQKFRAGSPASRLPQPGPSPKATAKAIDAGGADYDVVDDPDEAVAEKKAVAPPPAKKSSPDASAIAAGKPPKSRPPAEPEPEDAVEPEVSDEPDDAPRRRRKKKKRGKRTETVSNLGWVRWVVGFGLLLFVVSGLAIGGILAGMGQAVLIYGIVLAVMIPVSTVILIVSMIISSQIVGGIEFGEIHVVIPKAMALLLVVNLVYLIPCVGWVMVFPVMLLGFMYLFNLDMWESRFLLVINWGLNALAKWGVLLLVIGVLSSAGGSRSTSNVVFGGGGGGDDDGAPSAKDRDKLCESYLQESPTDELRTWLDGGNQRALRSRSHADSVAVAKDLYSRGAKRVTVVLSDFLNDQVAFTLVIELPSDSKARKKLIDWQNQVSPADVVSDDGQKFLLVELGD